MTNETENSIHYYVDDNYFKFKGNVDNQLLKILLNTDSEDELEYLLDQRELVYLKATESWALPVKAESSSKEDLVQENIKNIKNLLNQTNYKFILVESKNTNNILDEQVIAIDENVEIFAQAFTEKMVVVLQSTEGCDIVSISAIPLRQYTSLICKEKGFSEEVIETVGKMVSGDSFAIHDRTVRISVI